LDIIRHSVFTENTTFRGWVCLRFQVKPTQLDPINRATTYLRTPAPTQDRVYKLNTAQTICES
jgi:hypothetical protein